MFLHFVVSDYHDMNLDVGVADNDLVVDDPCRHCGHTDDGFYLFVVQLVALFP
jgi:hypothetical protein